MKEAYRSKISLKIKTKAMHQKHDIPKNFGFLYSFFSKKRYRALPLLKSLTYPLALKK